MKRSSLEAVSRALTNAEVPFLIVGGLAVVAHGYGRMTQDIDLVISLEPDSIRRAFTAFSSLGYRPRVPVTAEHFADPAQRQRWIDEKGMTVLNFHSDEHRETPVDVFVEEPFNFAEEYERALVEELSPGAVLRIVRLHTLLRLKESVGRPQDVADVAALRALHGDVSDD